MDLNLDFLTKEEKKRLEEFKETFITGKKAGILIGAGVSKRSGMPGGRELAAQLAEIGGVPEGDLISVCDKIEGIQGRGWLERKLAELLDDESISPSDVHQIASRTPYAFYLTTNVDRLMERAMKDAIKSYTSISLPQDIALLKGNKIPVIKFHGTVDHPHTMVFSTKDFQEFSQKKTAFETVLKHLLSTTSLLVVGYNAADQDFIDILRWIQSVCGSAEHIIIDFDREHQRKKLLELGCFLIDPGAERYDLLPVIMGFLAGMNHKDVKAIVSPELYRANGFPGLAPCKYQSPNLSGKLRHLAPLKKSQALITLQIASSEIIREEYCPENRQLYLQINLGDHGSLEKFQIASTPQLKRSKNKPKSVGKPKKEVLPSRERKLLGLLAVCGLPLKPFFLAKSFPDIEWKKAFRKFIRDGLLEKKDNEIILPKKTERTLLSDPDEEKSFHQEWIKALEPLKSYIDIPFFLTPHYFAIERFDEGVMVMAEVLRDMEPGWENNLYLPILELIAESKILNRINSDTRVHFYNTMGVCLSRTGSHMEAIKWYLRLRKYSKRIKHSWGTGQSYINCGAAYYEAGDTKKAERCYQKAVEHGKTTDDKWLLGRALHNLAMTVFDRDMDEAIGLLNESVKIKEELEDLEGIVGALLGYGNFALEKGEIKDGLQWYSKAEKKAKKLHLTYLHSLALINIGSANKELNKLHEAIGYYQKAREIAESECNDYSLSLALKGEAMARLENEEFEKAEILFRELYNLKKMDGNFQEMIISLHDVGIMLIKQKKYQEARKILGQTLKLANKNENWYWVYRCHLARAASYSESGDTKKELQTLKNSANKEEKTGFYMVAGHLWEAYIILLIAISMKSEEIERIFERCIQCFERVNDNYPHLSNIYKLLYQWRWDNNFSLKALDALEKLEKIAGEKNQFEEKIQAIDQRGVCLQELGIFEKAEKAHRYALKLARRLNDHECMQASLQNLGELLRKTHQLEESIRMSKEAEKIAGEINDIESQISISHNRALAVRQAGNIQESEKILFQCRDSARKNQFWYEYVRAIRGLAYTAQIEGKNRMAEHRYLKALAEADRRGLYEYKHEITLEYSDLLGKEKRFEEAIEILEKKEEHFKNSIDSHFYYMALAKLYENKNNLDLAKKNWEEAKNATNLIGNQTMVSECSEALESIYKKKQESQQTENELEKAIEEENNPEKKSRLMVKYMSILLSTGKEDKAESVFRETLEIVRKDDFKHIQIDLCMTYGNYLWEKGANHQYKALQVYFISMVENISQHEFYIEIGKHILYQSLTIEPQKRHKRIISLYKRLSSWLQKELQKEGIPIISRKVDYFLWPLKVSMRLPSIIMEEIFEYQIYKAIEEEMKSLNRISNSD